MLPLVLAKGVRLLLSSSLGTGTYVYMYMYVQCMYIIYLFTYTYRHTYIHTIYPGTSTLFLHGFFAVPHRHDGNQNFPFFLQLHFKVAHVDLQWHGTN